MQRSAKTTLILLALVTLFKGIVWAALVPIWHIPDEQAHFAQVQYFAELKKTISSKNDLSQEIYESEKLLGTLRDDRGINKFTYHPDYRIEYTNSLVGIHEDKIAKMPKSARTTLVKREAARYPPLFYIISTVGYFSGYRGNLFTRLFLTRLISVLIAVTTVYISFLLAKEIFPKSQIILIATASLVSLQPMFSFLSSGVNNDNLLNLLSTVLLWLMVKTIREGITVKKSFAMGTVIGLGILTKQLIYPFIPLPLLVLGFNIIKRKTKLKDTLKKLLPFVFSALVFGGFIFINYYLEVKTLPYWPQVTSESPGYNLTFLSYLSEKIPKLYSETLPWYWGVYNWLGVVLPLPVLRTIKLVILLAIVGLVKHALEVFRPRKISTQNWQLLLIIFSSFWFGFWLLYWDYMLIRSIGFSHGLQGRNFFPNLAGHMLLIVSGFYYLTRKHQTTILKSLVVAAVVLHFIGLKTMLASYYVLWPLKTLIIQASQYKPWFFKGFGLVLWFTIFVTILSKFIIKLLILKESKK